MLTLTDGRLADGQFVSITVISIYLCFLANAIIITELILSVLKIYTLVIIKKTITLSDGSTGEKNNATFFCHNCCETVVYC